MFFKFKAKIGTLIKEMNIKLYDLNKFSSLSKVD
jgi:hypothetical protein